MKLPFRRATPDQPPRCSGTMTAAHDGTDEQEYRLLSRTVVFCGPCADAAGRLGMIDRRSAER